jgi:hypothetical protein
LKSAIDLSFKRSEAVISLKKKRVSKSRSAKRQRIQCSAPVGADACFSSLQKMGLHPSGIRSMGVWGNLPQFPVGERLLPGVPKSSSSLSRN